MINVLKATRPDFVRGIPWKPAARRRARECRRPCALLLGSYPRTTSLMLNCVPGGTGRKNISFLISVNCHPGWRLTARTDGLVKTHSSRLLELGQVEKPCCVLRCLSRQNAAMCLIKYFINEAIELAKPLALKTAAKFVNGVLDKAAPVIPGPKCDSLVGKIAGDRYPPSPAFFC